MKTTVQFQVTGTFTPFEIIDEMMKGNVNHRQFALWIILSEVCGTKGGAVTNQTLANFLGGSNTPRTISQDLMLLRKLELIRVRKTDTERYIRVVIRNEATQIKFSSEGSGETERFYSAEEGGASKKQRGGASKKQGGTDIDLTTSNTRATRVHTLDRSRSILDLNLPNHSKKRKKQVKKQKNVSGFGLASEEATAPKPETVICNQLENLIKTKRRLKRVPNRNKWESSIRDLIDIVDQDVDRILRVLVWYTDHFDEDFIPKVHSADQFKDKFISIESKMPVTQQTKERRFDEEDEIEEGWIRV